MATEYETILDKLKIDYLEECGSRGGNEEGYLAYVNSVLENDDSLRRSMDQALICHLAEEVWMSDGLNPDAGMSFA